MQTDSTGVQSDNTGVQSDANAVQSVQTGEQADRAAQTADNDIMQTEQESVVVAKDEVLPLRRQWFYPEIQNDKLNNLLVYPSIAIGIFILILIAYNIYYKVRERRLNELNEKLRK